jgi:hypothetical protein
MKIICKSSEVAVNLAKVLVENLGASSIQINKSEVLIPEKFIQIFKSQFHGNSAYAINYETVKFSTNEIDKKSLKVKSISCDVIKKGREKTIQDIVKNGIKNPKVKFVRYLKSSLLDEPLVVKNDQSMHKTSNSPKHIGPVSTDEILNSKPIPNQINKVKHKDSWGDRRDWKRMRQGYNRKKS